MYESIAFDLLIFTNECDNDNEDDDDDKRSYSWGG